MTTTHEKIIKKEFAKRKQEWLKWGCPEFINDDAILYKEEKELFLRLMGRASANERQKVRSILKRISFKIENADSPFDHDLIEPGIMLAYIDEKLSKLRTKM
jgi:hypothetical protein